MDTLMKSVGPLLCNRTAFKFVVLNSKYMSPLWPMSNVGKSIVASVIRNVTTLLNKSVTQNHMHFQCYTYQTSYSYVLIGQVFIDVLNPTCKRTLFFKKCNPILHCYLINTTTPNNNTM